VIVGASLEEFADDQQWEDFFISSAERTPFSSPEFLKLQGNINQKFALKKNSEVLAALIVPTDSEGNLKPGSFGSMHQGVLFSSIAKAGSNQRTEIFHTLLDLTIKQEIAFDISLHPEINDLRPVNWLNSELPNGKKINISVKYTGLIPVGEYSSYQEYFETLPKMRRDEIIKSTLIVEESKDFEIFADLYKESFSAKGIDFAQDQWNELRTIFRFATEHPDGKLTLAIDQETSVPISATITIQDEKTLYYWFAATKPGHRQRAGNSKLMSSIIGEAIRSGMFRFDTCGMNSKEIGFFKGSFGAKPTPVYQIRYAR
jgi:hypothetical protein